MGYRLMLRLKIHFLLVVSLLIGLSGCSRPESAGAETRTAPVAKVVDTEPVRQETIRRVVEVNGTLAALDEVTVSSEVDGAVSKVLADLGDPVKAGQVMVE